MAPSCPGADVTHALSFINFPERIPERTMPPRRRIKTGLRGAGRRTAGHQLRVAVVPPSDSEGGCYKIRGCFPSTWSLPPNPAQCPPPSGPWTGKRGLHSGFVVVAVTSRLLPSPPATATCSVLGKMKTVVSWGCCTCLLRIQQLSSRPRVLRHMTSEPASQRPREVFWVAFSTVDGN